MIIVFSDTHLTHRFDVKLFARLRRLILSADQVIINGDFWDGYLTSFSSFVNSDWKRLFPILKKKNTIYIHGNHDLKSMVDQRVSLFCTCNLEQYEFALGKNRYYLQHGHLLFSSIFTRLSLLLPVPVVRPFYIWINKQQLSGNFLGKIFDKITCSTDEIGDVKFTNYVAGINNQKNLYFIFGHTHIKRFDTKSNYLNSGAFNDEKSGYVTIDESGCRF